MILYNCYKSRTFFLSSLAITTFFGSIAAYCSHQQSLKYLLFPLILLGMSSPTIVALMLLRQSDSKKLWSDFLARLHINRIKLRFIPVTILFMPCVVLCAISISLLFGYPAHQFTQYCPDQALEGNSVLSLLLIILLSCTLEEVGWRGYGIDSLNSKYTLLKTSFIFATIWSLWHVPSFFIKNGYFQQEVWNLGMSYVATYFISLFPITLIINWLYIKNNRSIVIAILFHSMTNLSYGFLAIQPCTKIIIMFLLLISAAIIVNKDKEIFLKKLGAQGDDKNSIPK